jgi:hypothetical protein
MPPLAKAKLGEGASHRAREAYAHQIDRLQTGGQSRRNYGVHLGPDVDLPAGGAAWAFSVKLPHKHFMVLLFVPFFYALATYFLVGLGCMLYNFAARMIGGIRIEVAHDTGNAHNTIAGIAEKPAPRQASAA